MSTHYYYLAIDAGCLLFPFIFSFDKRTEFYKSWRALFVGIALMMIVFIPWDIAFTKAQIWGFNPNYISGTGLLGLPIEEWLFFFCVPYAGLFSYVSVGYYFPRDPLQKASSGISWTIMALCLGLLVLYHDHAYTALTALLLLLLLAVLKLTKQTGFLGRFFLTYLFVMLPFMVTNGLLTGLAFWRYPLFNSAPESVLDMIVWYDNAENLGVRIFSVPVDDFLYAMLMLLMVTLGFEWVKAHQAKTASTA